MLSPFQIKISIRLFFQYLSMYLTVYLFFVHFTGHILPSFTYISCDPDVWSSTHPDFFITLITSLYGLVFPMLPPLVYFYYTCILYVCQPSYILKVCTYTHFVLERYCKGNFPDASCSSLGEIFIT